MNIYFILRYVTAALVIITDRIGFSKTAQGSCILETEAKIPPSSLSGLEELTHRRSTGICGRQPGVPSKVHHLLPQSLTRSKPPAACTAYRTLRVLLDVVAVPPTEFGVHETLLRDARGLSEKCILE